MADAFVTDTHPLILWAAGRPIGRRAAAHFEACERQAATLYVPVAVIWETSRLLRIGRLRLATPLPEFFDRLFSNPAYQPSDLTPAQVYLAHGARPNDDPLDALICAAALDLQLPLLTRDRAIQDWGGVRTVW